MRVSEPIFKQLSESYRKIRNTLRILLANLGTPETDFDPNRDMVAPRGADRHRQMGAFPPQRPCARRGGRV